MSISATVLVEHMASVNAALEQQGFGPGNFSVPLRAGTADATHAGLHCWDSPDFLAALQAIPEVAVSTDGNGSDLFAAHTASQSLEWSDPTEWHQNPVMKGDMRSHNGKNWESLVDFNVWTPPVAWREVVAEGYPAWVQPTGSSDAYPLGFKVTHNGQDWESDYPANVWEPGVFGWTALIVEPPSNVWAPGVAYTAGQVVTHLGLSYECRQSHTSQVGWEPPNVLALWLPL